MRHKSITRLVQLAAAVVVWCSCSKEMLTEYERTQADFLSQLNGEVSPSQWWMTTVILQIEVKTEKPVKIWAVSADGRSVLYDYRMVDSSQTIRMTVPQGNNRAVYLMSECNQQRRVQQLLLSGETEELVVLDVELLQQPGLKDLAIVFNERLEASLRVTDRSSLYGKSVMGGANYVEYTPEQRTEAHQLIKHYFKESRDAKSMGLNSNYELLTKGPFQIVWFAGFCMSSSPHVLGYYYHSPGTYEDIKYVDITETEIYDYIDGKAKVQYKVNQQTASQYGLLADHWYDANFDMGDTWTGKPSLRVREGDDAYNMISVMQRYGEGITDIRGISFTINVPAGMCVGFYDRIENVKQPEQYDHLVELGVKPYTARDKFKAMNLTCEYMNVSVDGGQLHRACVIEYDNLYWLGMENDYKGGDHDCNDIIFGVSSELEIYKPDIIEPDLKPIQDYKDKQIWTIAYEDIGREADFDFNDAVIQIMPDQTQEKCFVKVMAAGSPTKMYLHYDGPEGDQCLGEMHELLGGEEGSTINTKSTDDFVELEGVKWLKDYTVGEDARRFYIKIQRGACADCPEMITLAYSPGQLPEALLIAGQWKWPIEGMHILSAYSQFAGWAKDVTKRSRWNWYNKPNSEATVE